MAKRKIKESVVQSQILSYLKTRRILHNRVNNGQFVIKENGVDKYGRNRNKSRAVRCNSLNGIPDIEVFAFIEKDGNPVVQIPIYLEVKNETGRQSKDQKLFQSRIDSANGFYYVVRGIDDVKKAFEETYQKIKKIFGNEYNIAFLKAFSLVEKNGV